MKYAEIKRGVEKEVELLGARRAKQELFFIDIIEKQREALEGVISHISNGRKGMCGDHYLYTVQIGENAVSRWREALALTEEPQKARRTG